MSDFLQSVNELSPNFTHSQRVIADYLSENLDSVAFCTLEEMSGLIGVSTTTIIRFARALGYSGYSDMQKAIQANLKTKASLPERLQRIEYINSTNTLLADTFQQDLENMQKTLAALNNEDLEKAIDWASGAPNVYVLGMRSSFSISYYLATRLSEIRENIHLIQSVGMLYPEEIVSANEGDVCIAYMFPRYSKLSMTILTWLKEAGVKIILITSDDHAAVKNYGDIILPCAVSSISYKNSYSAPLSLANYLTAAIAQKDYEESQRVLKKTEEILNQGFYTHM